MIGITLSTCSYELIFKSDGKHGNADSVSRLPFQSDDLEESSVIEYYVLMSELCYSPTISEDVTRYSAWDPITARVMDYVNNGWPAIIEEQYEPYLKRRNELCKFIMSPTEKQSCNSVSTL